MPVVSSLFAVDHAMWTRCISLLAISGCAVLATLLTGLIKRRTGMHGKRVEQCCVLIGTAAYVLVRILLGARWVEMPLNIMSGIVVGGFGIGLNRMAAPKNGEY